MLTKLVTKLLTYNTSILLNEKMVKFSVLNSSALVTDLKGT